MKDRKVLFNFVPVSAGGGLQNAMSFISFLAKEPGSDFKSLIVCVHGSEIEKYCLALGVSFFAIRSGRLSRFYFEIIGGWLLARKINACIIFSIFGGSPFLSFGCKKISGFAYSNIIERDVDFWWFCSPAKKAYKKILDKIRLWSYRNSSVVILETERLSRIAGKTFFKGAKTFVVKMSPSSLVRHVEESRYLSIAGNENLSILYLCGPHENKRVSMLAPVFREIRKKGQNIKLLVTLPNDSEYYFKVRQAFVNEGVADLLVNLGKVPQAEINHVLSDVDGMINVALLESFSNNWVEAWAASIPLLVTDSEWAKESCKEAATYIDVHSPCEAALKIVDLYSDEEKIKKQILEGKNVLSSLPNAQEKFDRYLSIIKLNM